MDSPEKSGSLFLRSTSAVSLNERFSQALVEQPTQPRMVTFDPALQQRVCGASPLVLLVQEETPPPSCLQTCDSTVRGRSCPRGRSCLRGRSCPRTRTRARSVWMRLGWQHVACRLAASRPRGFWSFRRKYRWRALLSTTCRRQGNLRSRLGQRPLVTKKNHQRQTAGQKQRSLHLLRGGATTIRRRGLSKDVVPTRKQLDAQLDEYMSMSRSRLDKELEDYMSMSKRRLDAQLDEYMSLAGQTDLHWD